MLSFGTDGVRGDTRSELTESQIERLGQIVADVFGTASFGIGHDPRESGPSLVAALSRGVSASGSRPIPLGVLPTPAVARWSADEHQAAAMVSASHNPWYDNGVKFFAPGGLKLDDAAQTEIEERLADQRAPASAQIAASEPPRDLGMVDDITPTGEALERHISAVVASIEGRDLRGLRIVVDSANGAAHIGGPECLRRLGARVIAIHAEPDGRNINHRCGSLHPEGLQAAVLESQADAGVAFDGDADRVLAVDHRGSLVDGDEILAVCAIDRQRRGELAGATVVVTAMSNLGFRRAMAANGIGVIDTNVGDRYVLAALQQHGLALGGEQSGHVIFRELATTGDGVLTAVQLLDTVKRTGSNLADLTATAMTKVPQVLLNVANPRRRSVEEVRSLLATISTEAQDRLAGMGRVLLRASGTEPVVRVMVEADSDLTARTEAVRLCDIVREAIS